MKKGRELKCISQQTSGKKNLVIVFLINIKYITKIYYIKPGKTNNFKFLFLNTSICSPSFNNAKLE